MAQTAKNLPANAGDPGSTPGLGRSPEEGHGRPLQDSCLGNLMDRGAWRATVHGVARIRHNLVTKPLSIMLRLSRASWESSSLGEGDCQSL